MNTCTVTNPPRPMLPSSEAPALRRLLDASLQLPPEYRDELSSHLPMALHALASLGAGEARMQAFFASYARRFASLEAPVPAEPALDWLALRGQAGAYAPLRAYFEAALALEGRDALLQRVLPVLLPGVSAAALHGVIRTAHAVQAGHAGELAAALAYWGWRWQALTPPQPQATRRPLADWADTLVRGAPAWRSEAPLIAQRMADATAAPLYQQHAGGLAHAADLRSRLAEFAALALHAYLASRNFTALHMITGLRALRVLLPWISDTVALQDGLAQAVWAAYMAGHVKPMAAPPAALPQSWPEVVAAAIASDDDHVVKLVHACREEAQAYGPGRYLEAAALAVA